MNKRILAGLGLLAIAALPLAAEDEALRRFVFGLPKAELHLHTEGTLDPALYLKLAKRNGLATPFADVAAVEERWREAKDLPSFIVIYEMLLGVVRTPEDFRDMIGGYAQKARAQGVVYAELFFDPQLHLERGLKLADIFAGLEAGRVAAAEAGVEVHFIMCFLRDRPVESALQVLEASLPWRDRFIGVGLDNPEVKDFPQKFLPVYTRAKELGLHLTSHCDVGQVNTVAHHWAALNVLGVERIDHGLNVLDDPALIEAVRSRHIGLTAVPSLFYRDIPGRMEYRAAAVKKLLELGLLVSVNSDDPGMKRGLYVGDLMLRVDQTVGLTREQFVTLARNSFRISWMPPEQRVKWLAAIDAYVAETP